MSTHHRLEALHGQSPLGFLAALGTLALLSRTQGKGVPKLAWEPLPPHSALLTTSAATPEALTEELFLVLTGPDGLSPLKAIGGGKLRELSTEKYRERLH